MNSRIRKVVNYYKRKYNTSDPFEIASYLGIIVQTGELDFEGCYMFLKNHRCIFLNENLSEHETRLVMAHELGHAIMHRKENCYFMKNKTLLLASKLEIAANTFAMELLITDQQIAEIKEFTIEQMAQFFGYHIDLIQLRLHDYDVT